MESLIEKFLQYDRLAVPAAAGQWMPEERIRLLLRREWKRNEKLTTDRSFAESFQKRCPVPGAAIADYNYRLLALPGGRHVLASIRFRGLDLQKPFVDILHRDFAPGSPDEVRILAREVARHYEVFSPLWIRVFDSSGVLDNPEEPDISCDFRYYAAPVQQLRPLPLPPRFDEIALEPLTALDFYDAYAEMYHRLYADSPHLRFVPLETPETMEHYMNDGSLYRIEIDGRFAGVVGVLPQEEKFLSGYLVVEEILDRPFRRQGFAPALQRRLVEKLDGDNYNVLYGHISPLNAPSLRTASKVGRRDVGGVYFVAVADT